MEFRTKVIALGSTVGALFVLVMAGWIFSPENNQRRAAHGTLVSAKTLDKADSFTIDADGASIQLVRDGQGWAFKKADASFPASAGQVNAFFKAVSGVNELYKVSSRKDTWKSFGLEEGKKTLTLKDKSGTVLADIVVGGTDATGKKRYVAFTGKDQVYAVKDVFYSYLTSSQRSWADLRVFPETLKPEDVQELQLKADFPAEGEGGTAFKVEYRLQRDSKKGWKLVGDDAAVLDKPKVEALVRGLVNLEAEDIVSEGQAEAAERLKEVKASAILRSGKGVDYSLRVSAKDADGKHVLALDGKSFIYKISNYSLQYAWKSPESLKPDQPAK
jgi:hypothetical protein